MADPVVTLETPRLTVEPGGQVTTSITIRNTGTIVENYRVEVLFDNGSAAWAEVLPPEVPVFPQQQGSAVVVFSPPAGPQAPGGTVPFAVRAVSLVDPAASAVVEGDLEIGRIHGLQAKLAPVTSSGRWRAQHVITVSNWGNAPARLRWTPTDPDQRLGFLVRPEVVEVPLGGSATARLKVRTRAPVLRGTPMRLPFQVVGEPDTPAAVFGQPPPPYSDPGRPVVDGAFTQKPILSRGVVGVAAVAAIGLAAVAFFALRGGGQRPTFESEGRPGVPSGVQVVEQGTDSVTVAWKSMANIEKYAVFTIAANGNTSGSAPAAGDQNQLKVSGLDPATPYCFQVAAQRGKLAGARSVPPACTTTKKLPTSASPSATDSSGGASGSPTGGTKPGAIDGINPSQWILWDSTFPANDEGQSGAEQRRDDLRGQGFKNVDVLHTADFPDLRTSGVKPQDSWFVYLGPYDSKSAATAAAANCPQDGNIGGCQPLQPVPSP
jgi:hypothetical protein